LKTKLNFSHPKTVIGQQLVLSVPVFFVFFIHDAANVLPIILTKSSEKQIVCLTF